MPNHFPVATVTEGPGSAGMVPSDIFCTAALANADGQYLYLSLFGRDTAFQHLRGLMTAGKINSLEMADGNANVSSGWFSPESLGTLQYHGAKIQTSLFGDVSQAVFYQPILSTPDKAAGKAVVPFMGIVSDDEKMAQIWQVAKHICPVPLMDEWQQVVLTLLAKQGWVTPLKGFGGVSAISIDLSGADAVAALISANVRAGALRIEPDVQGRLAVPERMTGDLAYPRPYQAPKPALPAPAAPVAPAADGDGFWGGPISVHTRQMLVDDGDLVDVTDTQECREAGFRVPVALTRAVYGRFAEWDNGDVSPRQQGLGQSTAGRLWDILYMAAQAARSKAQGKAVRGGQGFMLYEVFIIERDGNSTTPRSWKLKLHSGPGDRGEHVITIMLPDED